jgi:hypothetical protein
MAQAAHRAVARLVGVVASEFVQAREVATLHMHVLFLQASKRFTKLRIEGWVDAAVGREALRLLGKAPKERVHLRYARLHRAEKALLELPESMPHGAKVLISYTGAD